MEQALNQFNNQVQNIPFFGVASGLYEDEAGERFSTKDPFYERVPKKDPKALKQGEKMEYDEVRRRPPPNIGEQQRKLWKKVMKRAWYHDRNFCGCMPIDLGCGMISIVSIFPIIGSIIAYKMHYKLIKMCNQAGCPASIQAKMVGNIGVDFMISLVPLLGVLFSWMKASSTRNAAMFDTWLRTQGQKNEQLVQTQNQRQRQLAQQAGRPPAQATQATRATQTTSSRQPPATARQQPSARPAQTRPAQTRPAQARQTSPPSQASQAAGPRQTSPPVVAQPSRAQSTGTQTGTPTSRASRATPPAPQPAAQRGPPRTARPARVPVPQSAPQSAPQRPTPQRPSQRPPQRPAPTGPPSHGPNPQSYPSYGPPQPAGYYNAHYNSGQAYANQWRPPPAGTYYNVEYTR